MLPDQVTEWPVPLLFEQQVALHPGRLAMKTAWQSYSYQALNQAANRLAHALLNRCGPQPVPVSLLFEDDSLTNIALLAALKAGKFFAAIDSSSPALAIARILADLQPTLVVVDGPNLERAAVLAQDQGCQTLCQDEIDDPSVPAENPGLDISPDAYAEIMYTSGSTGQPKGVLHSHRNLVHATANDTMDVTIRADDRLALLSSASFGASRVMILGALLNGAALLPYPIKKEGLSHLSGWLADERITILQLASTPFRHFAATLTGKERFPLLRLLRLGGETVSRADVELYRRYFPDHCRLRVALSTTESYGVCTYWIDKDTPLPGDVVPAGYPCQDKQLSILDEDGNPAGPGQAGEIAVRSRYLAYGYWRRPELTRARFLPDPEGGDRRIYLTGDLGRVRPDGCLEHLGRKDWQVKVRGYRVELGAIEEALYALSAVKEAVVVAHEPRPGETSLAAYVVPSGERPLTTPVLRSALAETLPDYMVPSTFVLLGALPLSRSGKVDRRALPLPGQGQPRRDAPYVAPATPMEETLAALWAEVLGVDRVGIQENFFDLGGHSLLVSRLFARIEQQLGKRLAPATVFEAPTVAQLARAIQARGTEAEWPTLVPIQAGGSKTPFFCIHGFGGGVLGYVALARLLGPEQPFYGLQAAGLDGHSAPQRQIEEMAAYYLNAIRAVQPTGPYFLGGYCYGGVVAYEMARQLLSEGERVGLAAILEGYTPLSAADAVPWWRPAVMGSFWRNLPGWLRDHLPRLMEQLLRRNGPVKSEEAEGPARLQEAQRQAIRSYRPQPYPGRVTLFRVRTTVLRRAHDPTFGWGRLAAEGVDVRMIPGAHHNILEPPHVEGLARQLKSCLDGTA